MTVAIGMRTIPDAAMFIVVHTAVVIRTRTVWQDDRRANHGPDRTTIAGADKARGQGEQNKASAEKMLKFHGVVEVG